jgi:hypothetical protein
MGKFFSRYKAKSYPQEPDVSTWGNLANFYSLLIFLIAIPLVLIVVLVWLTQFLGMTPWLFAGFFAICGFIGWRIYRKWGNIKAKMAAQGSQFHDLMQEAAKSGKNVEISLLNGTFTLRYSGQEQMGPAVLTGRPQPLALEGPLTLEADAVEVLPNLPPERLREELEGFVRLRDDGVISPEEFDRLKASLLQRVSA